MRCYFDKNVQVARRAAAHASFAFASQTDAGAGFDPGRDVHIQCAIFFDPPRPAAGLAGVLDDLPHAGTGRAGAFNGEKSLLRAHFSHAGTGWAGRGFNKIGRAHV